MNRSVRALSTALVAVIALVLAGLMSPAGAATSTAKIKGVVTLDGSPLSSATVRLYRTVYDPASEEYEIAGKRLKTDTTDSRGRYSFSGLSVKAKQQYVVAVSDRGQKTVKTFRELIVKKGRTTTKNFRMKPASSVRGVLRTSDGRSPAGMTVTLDAARYEYARPLSFDPLFPSYTTTVRADGSFALKGVPALSYDALIVADGPHARECFDSALQGLTDCAPYTGPDVPSQHVDLARGEQRTLPTLTKTTFAPPRTRVSGRVTNTSGSALKGISVRITGDMVDETVVTRSTGRFTLDASIPAGTYSARFTDHKNVWAPQSLGGGTTAGTFVVSPGTPVGGVDAQLTSRAKTKTAVKGGTGSAKVAMKIVRKATGRAVGGTLTLSSGDLSRKVTVVKGRATVTLKGLAPGRQVVVATYSGTRSTAGFTKPLTVRVE